MAVLPDLQRILPMFRLSAVAAFAALALSSIPASAQQVQAGVLECRGGESISFVVGSVSEFTCNYRPNFGPVQAYRARLTRAGVDVGVTAVSGLAWGVFAPTNQIGLGDLSGNYGGATAGGAFVVGAGANVMYGGSNNSFCAAALEPRGPGWP
jgi:hypothetical protein